MCSPQHSTRPELPGPTKRPYILLRFIPLQPSTVFLPPPQRQFAAGGHTTGMSTGGACSSTYLTTTNTTGSRISIYGSSPAAVSVSTPSKRKGLNSICPSASLTIANPIAPPYPETHRNLSAAPT